MSGQLVNKLLSSGTKPQQLKRLQLLSGIRLKIVFNTYQNQPEQLWLRWWDLDGNLLLIGFEEAQQQRQRADQAQQRAEEAQQQAEQERQKRQQLTEKLRSLTPDQLNALGITPADGE